MYSSINNDSYYEKIVMDTGLTLTSVFFELGTDTGGGIDTYPIISHISS